VPLVEVAHCSSQTRFRVLYLQQFGSQEVPMTLQKEMTKHDDYEYFANYLGVDYDDYVELVGDFDYSEGEVEYDYELTV
jgi:hypothetical protein